jgi:23S rRNA pseudouridine2605 synthase
MLSSVGHPVVRLTRVAFGPVDLGTLEPGAVRALSDVEVDALRASGR